MCVFFYWNNLNVKNSYKSNCTTFLLKFKNKTTGFAENYYDYLNGLIINNKIKVLQKY